MPQHEPSPEHACLARPRRSRTTDPASGETGSASKPDEPNSSEPVELLSLEAAQELVLQAIWPGLTAIRASILERSTSNETAIARLREGKDHWVLQDWPRAGDPSILNWIPAEEIAKAAARKAMEGLLMARGVLTIEQRQGRDSATGRATDIEQTVGHSSWVQVEGADLAAEVLNLWNPDLTWPDLELPNLWIAGCSDLGKVSKRIDWALARRPPSWRLRIASARGLARF